MKKLLILGSTGSIGVSTLKIIKDHGDEFELYGISGFSRVAELTQQIREFNPKFAHLPHPSQWNGQNAINDTKVISGDSELEELITNKQVDLILVAIVGIAALKPTYKALLAGKTVLLANKEALVCAGKLLIETEKKYGGKLIPIDSEHCALYQLLNGRFIDSSIRSLTLTASGGPFLHTPLSSLNSITPGQAVKHPRWSMGAKISIDSATMVNKALEIAEAHWLFNIEPRKIEVVIHPESIIHGLVNFVDGVSFAQASLPEMKAPISYALRGDFSRISEILPPLDLAKIKTLTFFELDDQRFPAPALMYKTLEQGEALPTVYNCANETAVEMFMKGDIKFTEIVEKIENALVEFSGTKYETIDDLIEICLEVGRFVENSAVVR